MNNKSFNKTNINYKSIWDGFWGMIEKDPKQEHLKNELMESKKFYERFLKK